MSRQGRVIDRTNVDRDGRDHRIGDRNIRIDRTLLIREVVSEGIQAGEIGAGLVDKMPCQRIEREAGRVGRAGDQDRPDRSEGVRIDHIVIDDRGETGCLGIQDGILIESINHVTHNRGVVPRDRSIDRDDLDTEIFDFPTDRESGRFQAALGRQTESGPSQFVGRIDGREDRQVVDAIHNRLAVGDFFGGFENPVAIEVNPAVQETDTGHRNGQFGTRRFQRVEEPEHLFVVGGRFRVLRRTVWSHEGDVGIAIVVERADANPIFVVEISQGDSRIGSARHETYGESISIPVESRCDRVAQLAGDHGE